jgi:hypothetical protein
MFLTMLEQRAIDKSFDIRNFHPFEDIRHVAVCMQSTRLIVATPLMLAERSCLTLMMTPCRMSLVESKSSLLFILAGGRNALRGVLPS